MAANGTLRPRLLWPGAQPILQDRRVDAPEVKARLQIPGLQIGEAGRVPHESGLDPVSSQKDPAGGAVVGARRAVLLDAISAQKLVRSPERLGSVVATPLTSRQR